MALLRGVTRKTLSRSHKISKIQSTIGTTGDVVWELQYNPKALIARQRTIIEGVTIPIEHGNDSDDRIAVPLRTSSRSSERKSSRGSPDCRESGEVRTKIGGIGSLVARSALDPLRKSGDQKLL
jgi:hypothetical protein